MEPHAGSRAVSLPPMWPLFGVVVVLPFVIASAMLEIVAPAALDPDLFADAFAKGISARIGHLGDRLAYTAVALVHLAACVIVIGYCIHRINRLDPARRRGATRLLGVMVVFAAVAIVAVRSMRGVAYELSFLNIRDLLQQTDVTHDFTTPAYHVSAIPYLADVTPIALAGGIPFLFGVIAVICAVPVAGAAASFESVEPADWQAEFSERVKRLQRAFYALSIVLVTSTFALMVFFHLPVELALDGFRTELLRYARGLTIFWGAVMTMTLLAGFGPAMLALRARARQRHRAVADDRDFADWFAEQVPISTRRQLANLATMLAPLMVGPVGTLLSSMLGGG